MSISTTSNVVFDVSRFCSQLTDEPTVGSKVTDEPTFMRILGKAVASHDPSNDEVKGQHVVKLTLSGELLESVSCGVGERFGRIAADYCTRDSRGVVGCYLKRKFALPVSQVSVVVYTLKAYVADPDVSDEEAARVSGFLESKEGDKYIIVAVLASYGAESPLSPRRFVANFAGGNQSMLQRVATIEAGFIGDPRSPVGSPSLADVIDAREAFIALRDEAATVTEYDEKYSVVAD